jgi:hypothetical protein
VFRRYRTAKWDEDGNVKPTKPDPLAKTQPLPGGSPGASASPRKGAGAGSGSGGGREDGRDAEDVRGGRVMQERTAPTAARAKDGTLEVRLGGLGW